MAVDLGKLSISEGDPNKPYVGAVVVREGEVIGSGHRGMTAPGDHAEFGVLKGIDPEQLSGATAFSTLEPCSQRNHPKIPCARRLVEAGVVIVYVGIYDPNPVIYRQGWRILMEAGVKVCDFPTDLRDEIAIDNTLFLSRFKRRGGDADEFTFDYELQGHRYPVQTSIGAFTVEVSHRGFNSIYIYDQQNKVGHARFATSFEQVDDPGALEFNARYVALNIGEIACLRNPRGYFLVQLVNLDLREGRRLVTFRYEVRGGDDS